MTEDEKPVVREFFNIIRKELSRAHESHTKQIVCTEMETLFNYSNRFYDRQFYLRKTEGSNFINRITQSLEDYFNSNKPFVNTSEVGVIIAAKIRIKTIACFLYVDIDEEDRKVIGKIIK